MQDNFTEEVIISNPAPPTIGLNLEITENNVLVKTQLPTNLSD